MPAKPWSTEMAGSGCSRSQVAEEAMISETECDDTVGDAQEHMDVDSDAESRPAFEIGDKVEVEWMEPSDDGSS